jgi:tRNA A37 threonylcarbamoyltransferase TsaD
MPNWFTCGKEITFDKTILSKTGKQIPLLPNKKFAHGHDKDGNEVNKPIEELGQQQLQGQESNKQTEGGGFTQGGGYMDTKRLRVMVEELQKKANENEELFNSIYQLCRNNATMLGELMNHFKLTEPTTAADMYLKSQKQNQQQPAEVHGWNSNTAAEQQQK